MIWIKQGNLMRLVPNKDSGYSFITYQKNGSSEALYTVLCGSVNRVIGDTAKNDKQLKSYLISQLQERIEVLAENEKAYRWKEMSSDLDLLLTNTERFRLAEIISSTKITVLGEHLTTAKRASNKEVETLVKNRLQEMLAKLNNLVEGELV